MNIIETEISHISEDNIDSSKLSLANNIIYNIKPIMDNILSKATTDIESISKRIKFKDNEIKTKKIKIKKDSEQLERQKKVAQLLLNVEKLIELNVIKNTPFKNELVILLKIIPKLTIEKLDKHIKKTSNIVQRHQKY